MSYSNYAGPSSKRHDGDVRDGYLYSKQQPQERQQQYSRRYSRQEAYSDRPPAYSSETVQAPPPPPHRQSYSRNSQQNYQDEPAARARQLGYTNSVRTASTTTPGADNLGAGAAGGGIAGIAYGVAAHKARESGVAAMRVIQNTGVYQDTMASREDNPYVPEPHKYYGYSSHDQGQGDAAIARPGGLALPSAVDPFGSQASLAPSLPRYAYAGGIVSPGRVPPPGTFLDTPLQRRSQFWDAHVDSFDPDDIEDDGDDGLQEPPQQARRSVLGFGNRSNSNKGPAAPVAGAGIGTALGGLTSRNASGRYNPVQTTEYGGPGSEEKSEWLENQSRGNKKMIWLVGTVVVLVILGIIGGVVGGVLSNKSHSSSGSSSSTADNDNDSTVLDINSSEIKGLMNNANLHRVFPGMAYTPLNAQYPDCLTNPPSQNNVTRDMAIMSQLTNTIRLYGTDCNQTEMVLESISRLRLTGMKVWLAVWLNSNDTTNARGLTAMHDLLSTYGADPFSGVILGNEVLYRKDLTTEQLTTIIAETRSNFTTNKIGLPIAVADLGDNWTADLTDEVDVVMSNVHPFFGGVPANQGAGWAWDFWQTHDVVLTSSNATKQNIISEIGWPSGGGQDCGSVNCTQADQGAVAGINEMNTFMGDFVCQSLTNKSDYFWFEAFDEPWKVQFNTPGEDWEDKWGLFDSNRNLKKGLEIPTCSGQSIPSH